MKIYANILLCTGLLSLVSCTTTSSGGFKHTETENIRAEVYQLSNRVNALETANQQLYSQMESLNAQNIALQAKVSDVENSVRSSEASLAAMKDGVITEISGRMSKLISETAGASSGGVVGRYHTVAQGDTLSAIATAYGSSMDVIVKANNLKNANSIRIGQKLFIPE